MRRSQMYLHVAVDVMIEVLLVIQHFLKACDRMKIDLQVRNISGEIW